MKIRELEREIRSRLSEKFGLTEAEWLSRIVMENVTMKSRVDLLVDGDKEVGEWRESKIREVTQRLLEGEPIQYIFGYETFMGLRIEVNSDVLIPRPETAELVTMILDEHREDKDLRVLDVCTGSGCISIALKRHLRFAEIDALEISEKALKVARRNAATLKTPINFIEGDALKMSRPQEGYDIVVSNPPYVLERERKEMDGRVLDYEPEAALFVPDEAPLKFYKAIAEYCVEGGLKGGGRLYFECNPLSVGELSDFLRKDFRWSEVETVRDSDGKERFVKATLER